MRIRHLVLTIFLSTPFTANWANEGETCTLKAVDAPGALGGTFIYGVNNAGQLSGTWYDAQGTSHGALWSEGRFESIDYPAQGPAGLSLFAGNDRGDIAGGYFDSAGFSHSVIYHARRKTFDVLPDFPGSKYNAAGSIDDSGRVSGDYTFDPTGNTGLVAWLYRNGTYDYYVDSNSDQPALGTVSYGMNNLGTIVGFYVDTAGNYHGFERALRKPPVTVDVPGSTHTVLLGINDEGAVTGNYTIGGTRHGLVYLPSRRGQPPKAISIDYPGASSTDVTGINDAQDIAGYYFDAAGTGHGFVGRGCVDD